MNIAAKTMTTSANLRPLRSPLAFTTPARASSEITTGNWNANPKHVSSEIESS